MNNSKPEISRLIELQELIISFGNVQRSIHRSNKDGSYVPENDIEHSFSLTILAWYLSRYFPELDQFLVIRIALAHDFVEVYSGDTYAYGDIEQTKTKSKRESDALFRLSKEWPDFIDITEAIKLYKAKESAEAKFVYALDKLQPILLNYINNGFDWKKDKISLKMLDTYKRNKINLSPEILLYYEQIYAILISSPNLIKGK